MEVIGLLSGGAPVLKKYQIAATTIAGIPVMTPASSAGGLAAATTTSAADMVGVTLDAATYTTVQGTGSSSAERLVTVVINPDAIIKMKMSGGATEDTALALQAVTTASSGGTAVTTAAEWSNPTYDEGIVWGYDGANVGQVRKITTVSSTAGTVVIPFDYGTVVGDNFLRAPFWPMGTINVQLSTLLTQANAIIAVGTGAEFRVIDVILNDIGDSGRTNSFVVVVPGDHLLNTTA